jgi:hypothetical protein
MRSFDSARTDLRAGRFLPGVSSQCSGSILPSPVKELLKTKFSNWKIMQLSDMDQDDRDLWLKGPNGKLCPGLAVGHFDNAETPSYALLLISRSIPGGDYKIVIFSKNVPEDTYSWRLLDHGDGECAYCGIVISRVLPGKYHDWEGAKSIRIKLDGLLVEWLEKGAVLYFRSAGQYRKLQVSD